MSAFISLCVPTYKRVDLLKRLFDSIIIQTFKDYEIIVTDNSDDDSVRDFVEQYQGQLPILYYKNIPTLSMAENWNRNVSMANGKWLKMIHDDDWLANGDALQKFADAASGNADVIFSGYNLYYENTGQLERKAISRDSFAKINNNPFLLFADNITGPPSTTLIKKEITEQYDSSLKWYIDIDYYFRVLKSGNGYYIDEPLVNISQNAVQTTNSCFLNPEVEIPESLHLYNKYGKRMTSSIILFDAWWRLIRNLGIRDIRTLKSYNNNQDTPSFLNNAVQFQKYIPKAILKQGVFSKVFMFFSYCFNKITTLL